jgi:hypothetical protein
MYLTETVMVKPVCLSGARSTDVSIRGDIGSGKIAVIFEDHNVPEGIPYWDKEAIHSN